VALSSDTRVEIIKALNIRPMTVSELAVHLDLAKSTVHEHLCILADRGMVTKDEDRKWRYYSLSERMRLILRPGNIGLECVRVHEICDEALDLLPGGSPSYL